MTGYLRRIRISVASTRYLMRNRISVASAGQQRRRLQARRRSGTGSRCCLRRRRRVSDLKGLLQGILVVQAIELEMWRALLWLQWGKCWMFSGERADSQLEPVIQATTGYIRDLTQSAPKIQAQAIGHGKKTRLSTKTDAEHEECANVQTDTYMIFILVLTGRPTVIPETERCQPWTAWGKPHQKSHKLHIFNFN